MFKGKLNYLGSSRAKKVYGGWVKKILDPKTVSVIIDKDKALEWAIKIIEYSKQDTVKPLYITIYRKNEDVGGARVTFTTPY